MTFIIPILFRIKGMGKVPLVQFCQMKVDGKRSKGMAKKFKLSLKIRFPHSKDKILAPWVKGFDCTTLIVHGFEKEVAVKSTKIMKEGNDFSRPHIIFYFRHGFTGV